MARRKRLDVSFGAKRVNPEDTLESGLPREMRNRPKGERRLAVKPSLLDYARTVSEVAQGIRPENIPMTGMRAGKQLGPAIGGGLSALYDYARSTAPGQVVTDVLGAPARLGASIRENPSMLYELIPGSGTVQGIREGAQRLAEGDPEAMRNAAALAAFAGAMDVIPGGGKGANLAIKGAKELAEEGVDLAAREVVRPRYIRTEESPFTIIRREDLRQEPIPEAVSENSLAALRKLSQDRSRSPAIRVADEAAIEARGVPYDAQELKPISSLKRQAAIGRAFQEAASGSPEYKSALFERFGEALPRVVEQAGAQNIDQLTEAAYRKLGEEVTHQFDKLPLEFRYHQGAGEYPSSTAMIQDALGRGQLNVFSGGEPHEFLGVRDPVTGLTQNEMFRAVHDYLGHVVPASRFGPSGEEIAYAAHAQQLSPLAQLALLSETRGQNSFVNYTPVNADITAAMNTLRRQQTERRALARRAARGDKEASSLLDLLPSQEEITSRLRELGQQTQFAEQKAVLLPPEFLETMTPGTTPSWLREVMNVASPVSARGVHISTKPDLEITDPSFFGSGHQGQEYGMVRSQNLPLRTYYYSGPSGTVIPEEPVMGIIGGKMVKGPRYAYEADLHNLYDIQEDPEGLVRLAQAYNLPDYEPVMPYYMLQAEDLLGLEGSSAIPDLERLIRDYAYSGYVSDVGKQRAAAAFDPISGLRQIERGPEGFSNGGQVMPLENRNGHHLRHDQSEVPEGTTS